MAATISRTFVQGFVATGESNTRWRVGVGSHRESHCQLHSPSRADHDFSFGKLDKGVLAPNFQVLCAVHSSPRFFLNA
jgi:hypothetical protein